MMTAFVAMDSHVLHVHLSLKDMNHLDFVILKSLLSFTLALTFFGKGVANVPRSLLMTRLRWDPNFFLLFR